MNIYVHTDYQKLNGKKEIYNHVTEISRSALEPGCLKKTFIRYSFWVSYLFPSIGFVDGNPEFNGKTTYWEL